MQLPPKPPRAAVVASPDEFIVPPSNIQAEQTVLGSMLIDSDTISLITATGLKPRDFYRERHGTIFQAVQTMYDEDRPVDFLTVCDELERLGKLKEIGGAAYISELINEVPSVSNADYYATIVRRDAKLRRLIDVSNENVQAAYTCKDADADAVVDEATAKMLTLADDQEHDDSLHRVGEGLSDLVDEWEELQQARINGNENAVAPGVVLSGYHELDDAISFGPGRYIIIAARTSEGKSSLALNLARNATRKFDKTVAYFSLEMMRNELQTRLIAIETGINSRRLETGRIETDEEWELILAAASDLQQLNLWVDDNTDLTLSAIRAKCKRLQATHGLDAVFIDYLGLIAGEEKRFENRQVEVSIMSKAVRNMARSLRVPIYLVVQINRNPTRRGDDKPLLSDLRDSGTLEQDAHVVLLMYNDKDNKTVKLVEVAKNRGGKRGAVVQLGWNEETTKFDDLEITFEPLEA